MAEQSSIGTSKQYLLRGGRSAIELLIILPVVCVFTLAPLMAVTEYAPFAFATYLGLVGYLAANSGRTMSPRIKDLEEPEHVKTILSIILFFYLNTLIIVGSGVGQTLQQTGLEQWAIVGAMLTPAVDSTLARFNILSLGLIGKIIIGILVIVASIVQYLKPDSSFGDAVDEVQNRLGDLDSLYEELFNRLDDSFSAWA